MSAKALAVAIRALAPSGVTKYDGQAPSGAAMPYLVVNQSVPDIDSRSEASTPHGRVGQVLLTVAGATEDAVLGRLDVILPAFEGARPVVAGWNVSPLRQVGLVRVYPDSTVTLPGGFPMVGKATFEYAVTRTP